mgnify:CR=1 FL=1
MKRATFAVAGLLLAGLAVPTPAQEASDDGDIPPEQRIAPGKGEPEVRIIQRPDMTIEEYSVGGKVYMIKVDPDAGPPYYLIDRNGDGEWDDRMSEIGPDVRPPQWTIFEW